VFGFVEKSFEEVVNVIVSNLERIDEEDESKFDSSTIDLS